MYIEPNTNIRILKDVPLDPSYENTVLFSSESSQRSYFVGKTKHLLTQNTYQRVNRGVIRVGVPADSMYDCNYCMFQNASYSGKWFYAFITLVEYVNNRTADVHFVIDVLQTYAFDYTLKECLIERQHSTTDNAGDNLVPEGLETGEYVSENITSIEALKPNSIVIAVAATEGGQDYHGGYFNGTYSGTNYLAFPNTPEGAEAAKNQLNTLQSAFKTDSIVSLFLMPTEMVGTDGSEIAVKTFSISGDNPKSFNGYIPRNKKLLTSPYSFLTVSTRTGTANVYNWEFFNRASDEGDYQFYYFGDTTPNPSVWLTPFSYKGLAFNYDEACVMTGFPQISYNVDTYRAWVAQSSGTVAMNALTNGVGAYQSSRAAELAAVQASFANPQSVALASAASAAGAAVAPAAIGAVAFTALKAVVDHVRMPTVSRGIQSSMAWAGRKAMTFYFDHKHITQQFARIIDGYFDMYGYAQHTVAVPNRKARRHWTYVKTIGCAIVGSMPSDDIRKIESIYDAGIRFWVSPSEVGNYELDNTI